MRRLASFVIPVAFLSGCFGPGEGIEAPAERIYFPVGLALDAASTGEPPQHLFVVSSDFDLQFNSGSVQSYDLAGLRQRMPTVCSTDQDCEDEAEEAGKVCDVDSHFCVASAGDAPCAALGERKASAQLLYPGRCNYIDPTRPAGGGGSLLVDSVKIGAFATDALLRPRPAPTDDEAPWRLLVPVRGDSTLHWIDVGADGKLDCGQSNDDDGGCDDAHRAGDDPSAENTRNISLGAEPFAIDAASDGDAIVVTNQTIGTASLFTDDWIRGPQLKFALAGDLPSRPVGVASLPGSDPETFLLTFRNAAQVRVLRFFPDDASPARPFLVDGGPSGIEANSVGTDSRGLAVDASAREAAKGRCADDDDACITAAALTPVDVYVANRSPASLLIGRTRPPQEQPYFFQTVPLTFGPSRVVVGKVRTAEGSLETRVFVVCFDSRRIFIYDPARSRVETEVLTGRGPHAIAVDAARALLYVAHFTDSFLGVISLDLGVPATYGTMIATVGRPSAPRSSK